MKENNITNLELYKLLSYKPFNVKLSYEANLQKEFRDYLTSLSIDGSINFVWFSVPNNFSGNYSPIFGSVQKATGLIAGAPDMIFMWDGGSGAIEFKSKKNKQTDAQILFEKWCIKCGVKYEIARSFEDAFNIIKKWGLI